ncbi:MAG: ABC transporter permease [Nocardioidaceae bacterium]
MLGYIVRRLISAFLVVVLTSMFVFALFFLGPSNPAAFFCSQNGRCTPQKEALISHELGLDQSIFNQYGVWVKGLFVSRKINMGATYECAAPCLGISYITQQEVRPQIISKYPATLSLAIGGSAVYLGLGVLLGALAARWRGSVADRSLVTGSLLVSSIPYYLVCLLAWLYLYLSWGVFPATGYFPITQSPIKWFAGLLLPWLVLGLTNSTSYARFSRGYMVESLGEDYVRSATAKGVSSNKAVFKHALRAAIVPVVTIFGLDFATLLGGTVFTEYIFSIDGVGNFALTALKGQDFPIVSATVLLAATLIVIANLVVDVVYSFLDPRVRLS